MPVVIKNMDMPNTCLDCQFCFEIDEGIKACCSIMSDKNDSTMCREIDCKIGYCQDKPEWCPLEYEKVRNLLSEPFDKVEKSLKDIGISCRNDDGSVRNTLDVLKNCADKWNEMN